MKALLVFDVLVLLTYGHSETNTLNPTRISSDGLSSSFWATQCTASGSSSPSDWGQGSWEQQLSAARFTTIQLLFQGKWTNLRGQPQGEGHNKYWRVPEDWCHVHIKDLDGLWGSCWHTVNIKLPKVLRYCIKEVPWVCNSERCYWVKEGGKTSNSCILIVVITPQNPKPQRWSRFCQMTFPTKILLNWLLVEWPLTILWLCLNSSFK